jgi:hypothetical protein
MLAIAVPLCAQAVPVPGEQDEKVTVPKSMLTQDQLRTLNQGGLRENVSAWAGVGKEVGEAVNSSMKAISEQTNSFANTKAGKITIYLLIWKLFGNQAVHLTGGFLLMLIFLPLWIWSYRKTCLDRSIRTGKDTYQVFSYQDSINKCRGEAPCPRTVHWLSLCLLVAIFLFTVYSY